MASLLGPPDSLKDDHEDDEDEESQEDTDDGEAALVRTRVARVCNGLLSLEQMSMKTAV